MEVGQERRLDEAKNTRLGRMRIGETARLQDFRMGGGLEEEKRTT